MSRVTNEQVLEALEKTNESVEELTKNFDELRDNLEPMASMFCKIRNVGWFILAAMVTVLLEPKLALFFDWITT